MLRDVLYVVAIVGLVAITGALLYFAPKHYENAMRVIRMGERGASGSSVPTDRTEAAEPLAQLETSLNEATKVPFTEQVRLDRRNLRSELQRLRELESSSMHERAARDELVQLLETAPEIPLAGEVRVDRQEAKRLIRKLRDARVG